MAVSLKPLQEQIIVITGASSGIGLETALTAAARGAKLVLAARSSQALDAVVRQINAEGGAAVAVVADVAQRSNVQRIAEVAIARFGRIDTWINNSGLGIYGRLDEVSDDDSRRLFDVNFWGVVYGSLVALPHLKQNGGALINVGSETSEAAVPLIGMYSASKHAVKGFTDALRIEVEEIDKANVSITLIQPTAVDTPFAENARNYTEHEPRVPAPAIEPHRVAEAILHAAVTHQRDVKVGAGAVLNTLMAKVAPSVADSMAAKQLERQQLDDAPVNPAGILYSPSETGRVKGRNQNPDNRVH